MAIQDTILGFAQNQNWLALGINLILSTIIGGFVVLIVVAIIAKKFSAAVNLQNAFLMVLAANIINVFFIGFLTGFVPSALSLFVPILIWIVLTKVFFGQLKILHAVIVGIVLYALSIILIPNLISMVLGYFPGLNF